MPALCVDRLDEMRRVSAFGALDLSFSASISSVDRSLNGPHDTFMAEVFGFCLAAALGAEGDDVRAAATRAAAVRRAISGTIMWAAIRSAVRVN